MLEADGRTLSDVGADEWESLDPELHADTPDLLTVEAAIARRATPGGPSEASVRAQIATLRAQLAR
jgi:argininosuccinate lyase